MCSIHWKINQLSSEAKSVPAPPRPNVSSLIDNTVKAGVTQVCLGCGSVVSFIILVLDDSLNNNRDDDIYYPSYNCNKYLIFLFSSS